MVNAAVKLNKGCIGQQTLQAESGTVYPPISQYIIVGIINVVHKRCAGMQGSTQFHRHGSHSNFFIASEIEFSIKKYIPLSELKK